MPLTPAAPRTALHDRVVTCRGYQREDGLLEIEGRMVDTKTYRFANRDRGGWIEAGEALHDMSIRLTLDLSLEVVAAEAVIDASPYDYCTAVTGIERNLVGLRIEPGWTNKSKLAMGANRGCTHLTELLGPVATTAIQTLVSMQRHRRAAPAAAGGDGDRRRPGFIDSCHTYASDSPVVREHWPEFYSADSSST